MHSLLEGLLLFREGKGEGLLDIRSRRAERPQGSAARERPREHTGKGRHGFPTTGDEVSFRENHTTPRACYVLATYHPPPHSKRRDKTSKSIKIFAARQASRDGLTMLMWMLASPALNMAPPAAVRSLHHRMPPPAMHTRGDRQPFQSGIMPYTGYNGVNPNSGGQMQQVQGRYNQGYGMGNSYNQGPYQGQYQQQYGMNQQRRGQQYGMGGNYGNYNQGGRYQQQYGMNQQRRGQQYGMGGNYGGNYNQINYQQGYGGQGYGQQGYGQYGQGYNNNQYGQMDEYDDYGRQYPSQYGQVP